jgi:hypothetical protein
MGAARRRLMRPVMLPYWIARSLVFIGVWYLVLFPFHINWYGYGLSIVVAAVYGFWVRRRWRITVLEKSDQGVVYWVRRVKKGERKAQEQPPAATDGPTRLDQSFPSAEALRRSGAPPPS